MTSAAGKFGPYSQPGAGQAAVPGVSQTGSELVRSRIALRVRLASMQPGGRLPDISELAEELRISEFTVRRALEGMCQDGLLDRRRGRAGGTFVSAEWSAVAALTHDPVEAAVLLDFHQLIEFGLVARASGGIPADSLEGLRELTTRMDRIDDPALLAQLETRFHLDLAGTLGGPAIEEFVADLLGRLCLLQAAPEADVVRARNRSHADLVAALDEGATGPAVRALRAHDPAPAD